jgi:hypothetical protein
VLKATPATSPVSGSEPKAFDLNIERVLEHWPVAHAVREFIANALDEHHLTETAEPVIAKSPDGSWYIEDSGRGLQYLHLTQKENPEKLKHPAVIGQFGIGLKDALAVCDRRGIGVIIRSRYGDISTKRLPKSGFPDITTLHGLISPPSEPERRGTRVELLGVKDEDIEAAKASFLAYSGDRLLESSRFGDILAKDIPQAAGRIYIKGLLVAEEPNFLFSYNITKLSAPLRRALNRERSNVGRGAYSDRIKDILKESQTSEVVGILTKDLSSFASGRMHDELSWKDVALHACRVLQSNERVVFVRPWQIGLPTVDYARNDGYRLVVVPDDIAAALGTVRDLDGRPMLDLGTFQKEWNQSFSFVFVHPDALTDAERVVYEYNGAVCRLAGIVPARSGVKEILISETMRLNEEGTEVLGIFDRSEGRVVVRRDQLSDLAAFCGTLLHELEHAASGHGDRTLEFEEALTRCLGRITSQSLSKT